MVFGGDENGSDSVDTDTDNFSFSERILGSNMDTESIYFFAE
jgi:hypothetical protein